LICHDAAKSAEGALSLAQHECQRQS
jgi:hypothetical protein